MKLIKIIIKFIVDKIIESFFGMIFGFLLAIHPFQKTEPRNMTPDPICLCENNYQNFERQKPIRFCLGSESNLPMNDPPMEP